MNSIERTAETQEAGKQTTRSMKALDVIRPDAAGLDLHKEVIVACAPMAAGDTRHPVKKFGTYTSSLLELAAWLKQHGVTTVAMEATGVFWLPVIGILRAKGLEVLLVNAREVRSVKGRPTSSTANGSGAFMPADCCGARSFPTRKQRYSKASGGTG